MTDPMMMGVPLAARVYYETKALGGQDVTDAVDRLMTTFEDFKATNDARLDEIERHCGVDTITEEKLARIDAALDAQQRHLERLTLKSARPALSAAGGTCCDGGSAELEKKAHFEAYVRHGQNPASGLSTKALSSTTGADGGYLVPAETETSVLRALGNVSPIRAIAGNRQVTGSVYKKPFSVSGPGTGWVAETDPRTETTSPTLAELNFPTLELYAMPAASASLLDDAAVDIDAWLAEEVRDAFAEQESAAFINGNGTTQPKGLLSYPVVAQSAWSHGNIGSVVTGADGGFAASAPGDALIDLVYSVRAGYRANAHWLMNRKTQAEIRKLKDDDGHHIWQPSSRPGEPATLLSFPIAEAEDMPDIATGAHAIAFGDFQRGYLVVDRVGLSVLRDPYSSKPYVLFYTTKRVGGGVQDFDAIKVLTFAAS